VRGSMKWLGTGLLCLMVVGFATPAAAQGVSGGFKIGVNFADLTLKSQDTDDVVAENHTWRTGFAAGGYVDVAITDTFSFAPEVLFTQKGTKAEGTEEGIDFEAKATLTQVQIPLLFKAKFAPGATVRPFVTVGPALGFKAKSRFKIEVPEFPEFNEDEDINEDIESVDFSIVVGGGVQFGPGSVEIRYDHGLRDVFKETEGEGKTRTFSILFGVGWSK
jgi:hypothetical protein